MIKKLSIVCLGMLLSTCSLNACEDNNQNDSDCSNKCFAEMDQSILKNIHENAVHDYLNAKETKQACQREHKNAVLKGVAIGVGASAGVVLCAVAIASYKAINFLANFRLFC